VVLFLDSAGGQVEEGDRVIEALNEIKLRRQLVTVVPHGKLCASMCIPIFLQGEERLAARASVWIFHEVAQRQANGQQRTDTAETWRLFRKYYAPAGVSTRWLKSIAPMKQTCGKPAEISSAGRGASSCIRWGTGQSGP